MEDTKGPRGLSGSGSSKAQATEEAGWKWLGIHVQCPANQDEPLREASGRRLTGVHSVLLGQRKGVRVLGKL